MPGSVFSLRALDERGEEILDDIEAGEAWGFEMTASDVAAIDPPRESCRVYWGSHGCKLERGHNGPHLCDCADKGGFDPETREYYDEPGVFNVGAPPYYGPDTRFYGEDVLEGPQVQVEPLELGWFD